MDLIQWQSLVAAEIKLPVLRPQC